MVSLSRDVRGKDQLDPIVLELHGDGAGGRAALHDGTGNCAADQEIGFLAVGGHQVRLGQNLEDGLVLQGLDERAQVQLGIEREQVQRLGDA